MSYSDDAKGLAYSLRALELGILKQSPPDVIAALPSTRQEVSWQGAQSFAIVYAAKGIEGMDRPHSRGTLFLRAP